MSSQITAFATVAGAFYHPDRSLPCTDPAAIPFMCARSGRDRVPMLSFHGTEDATIAYEGGRRRGACLPEVRSWARGWAERNGVVGDEVETVEAGGGVLRVEFGSGLVTLYRVEGLGHAWPSRRPNSDSAVPSVLDATPIILQFFERWSMAQVGSG